MEHDPARPRGRTRRAPGGNARAGAGGQNRGTGDDTAADAGNGGFDAARAATDWARLAERTQRVVRGFLERNAGDESHLGMADPLNVGSAFLDMTARLMTNPAALIEAQVSLWEDYVSLWKNAALRMLGEDKAPVATPAPNDYRFRDAAWSENVVFDYIKQSYLLTARWLQKTVARADGLDDKTAKKIDFYTRQLVDAMAPSNFVLTNPEVLRATVESHGDNLLKGLENLLDDLEHGQGQLSIRQTDASAFRIGENIAVTPGKVVFQTPLMQLIQYAPTTPEVHRTPVLILPPWINKYYILDLRPRNSLVRWLVSRGYTVFMTSWVNPDTKLARKSFADYMTEGPLAAIEAIRQATGERQINTIGYCIGGTLLAATLAYMAAKGDDRVGAAAFLTTLVDFREAGELTVFIDEEQLRALERRMDKKGYLDGRSMAATFNMLRANDLIWSFVINNYLLGKDPFPFDLLFWNSDSTRMPRAMHSFYLRRMYQENLLAKPNGIQLLDTPIDLGRVSLPVYVMGASEDHIAPWKAVYAATQLYRGPVRFVLAGSGHVAGVVNPPETGKYSHFANEALPADPDIWLHGAERRPGSWWPDMDAWLAARSGAPVPARIPGEGGLKAIEDAPGSYVKVRGEA